MFDVVIIGAGPAGTAAAFDLLRKGRKVLILDKHSFPRKKACAGGITPKGYHLFRYDISSVVKRECRTILFRPANGPSFSVRDENPLCYMTKREELDLFSLKQAIRQGADFRVINRIHSIEETPFSVTITCDSVCFRASYLIGADGANSRVRRFVAHTRFYQKQFAIEADVRVSRPDQYQMEFDFSKLHNCYYWIFPRDDHVNIGIYSVDSAARLQRRRLFEYARLRFFADRLEAVKGYPICTGGFHYRPDSKRIFLAGDAAGMAERLLGEGIFFAVKSGQLAAQSILESDEYTESVRDLYVKKLKAIQMDLRLYDFTSKWLYNFPGVSLKALSFPFLHRRLAKGYADGKTLAQILMARWG